MDNKKIPLFAGYQSTIKWDLPQITPGRIEYKNDNIDVGNMGGVLDQFANAGISLRVTSGVRTGATTSNGRRSYHSTGDAIDVTPVAGQTMQDIQNALLAHPELVKWMQDNGYGVLRETSDAALAKTGGTGYHWHIGKDNAAKKDLDNMINNGGLYLES